MTEVIAGSTFGSALTRDLQVPHEPGASGGTRSRFLELKKKITLNHDWVVIDLPARSDSVTTTALQVEVELSLSSCHRVRVGMTVWPGFHSANNNQTNSPDRCQQLLNTWMGDKVLLIVLNGDLEPLQGLELSWITHLQVQDDLVMVCLSLSAFIFFFSHLASMVSHLDCG